MKLEFLMGVGQIKMVMSAFREKRKTVKEINFTSLSNNKKNPPFIIHRVTYIYTYIGNRTIEFF